MKKVSSQKLTGEEQRLEFQQAVVEALGNQARFNASLIRVLAAVRAGEVEIDDITKALADSAANSIESYLKALRIQLEFKVASEDDD